MNVPNKIREQGNFLFRWRSYLPLVMLLPASAAFIDALDFEARFGEVVEHVWIYACWVISFTGLVIRAVTVGFVPGSTSGRNTTEQRASVVNKTGMYSIVKNPLYLGNFLMLSGIVLWFKAWWLLAIVSLAYWLYIERIIAAEESFLAEKFGPEYTEWANRTPIFIPNFKLWQKPEYAFSLRTVLRREYNGLMGMATAFFVLEAIADLGMEHENFRYWLTEDLFVSAQFVMAAIIFLTLRTLKKQTTLLHVEGR